MTFNVNSNIHITWNSNLLNITFRIVIIDNVGTVRLNDLLPFGPIPRRLVLIRIEFNKAKVPPVLSEQSGIVTDVKQRLDQRNILFGLFLRFLKLNASLYGFHGRRKAGLLQETYCLQNRRHGLQGGEVRILSFPRITTSVFHVCTKNLHQDL